MQDSEEAKNRCVGEDFGQEVKEKDQNNKSAASSWLEKCRISFDILINEQKEKNI
jgi:hypothetical protein